MLKEAKLFAIKYPALMTILVIVIAWGFWQSGLAALEFAKLAPVAG